MCHQVSDADRLHAAAEINESIHDARSGRRRFASAEIRRGRARHERMNAGDRGDDEQRRDADDQRHRKEVHRHHGRHHEHERAKKRGGRAAARLEEFVGDQPAGKAADDAEHAQQQSPVVQNAIPRPAASRRVAKIGVPLHDAVAQDAGGEFDEGEHQHQRIEENFLQQIERGVLLVHLTGRSVMRVEMREAGIFRRVLDQPEIQHAPNRSGWPPE